ncbi:argininosuccinate lyase [Tumebacillus algifaecis]|uniref:argininosuccinate lyase n=1 Tax=Tumebacillus algifaecis TaxID=1214604 RepID=A0A223CYD4_9BACL|nr:lyase family protein [Tumebacillus algifaecis]ASS74133.1 argininosuccinate lyase [Tumebacillus algifaecis]
MTNSSAPQQATLSGRISSGPSQLLHEEILEPQFSYELHHFLPWYLLVEKVMTLEYERLGLVSAEARREIGTLLAQINTETITADPQANMSDIAFAIERFVETRMTEEAPAWHMDRSRNDFQACAQIMFGRDQLLQVIDELFHFSHALHQLAQKTVDLPMPGYTHYQSAQVISPGFYLAAVNEQVLKTISRLSSIYDDINRCPLGSGAMAGLELAWDQKRMSDLLGFHEPVRHALIGVANREWSLRIAGELSTFSVNLSRVVTDLIAWGSTEYGLIDLPDQLAGISSAMPQKKNFPILERIRGRIAHISAYYMDFAMGQRNTAYTNLVETSKEAGSNVLTMFKTMRSALKLFTAVIENLTFKEERMRAICEREYFGGFTLANMLALHGGVPYRKAQVLSGRYIMAAIENGLKPTTVDLNLLQTAAGDMGLDVSLTEEQLRQAFDTDYNLQVKKSVGATSPERMRELLAVQETETQQLQQMIEERKVAVQHAFDLVEELLK